MVRFGVKVSYDDAFETRVMATLNYTFGNLIRGDEAEKQAGLNWLMNALSASPENRDVRVLDGCERPCQIHEACIGPSRPGTSDGGCQVGTRMVDYQNTYINGHWVTADVACKAATGKPCIPCWARCGSTSTSGCAEGKWCQ